MTRSGKNRKKYKSKYNPVTKRRYALKSAYGLSIEEYDRILLLQDGKCAICKTDTPNGRGRFHVDHDHNTEKIRGLLCHHCNLALGNFKDNIHNLLSAIAYLNREV
jgi:hypothetical protein